MRPGLEEITELVGDAVGLGHFVPQACQGHGAALDLDGLGQLLLVLLLIRGTKLQLTSCTIEFGLGRFGTDQQAFS